MNVFRVALSRDFWLTGFAIAHVPQPFGAKRIDGNLFFTEQSDKSVGGVSGV
jgi:hypothetical protein